MVLGTVFYYGWWLRRYYPSWRQRTPDASEGKPAQKDKPVVVDTAPREPKKAEQPQLPQQPIQKEPLQVQQAEPPQPLRADTPQSKQTEEPHPELPFPRLPFPATIEANCKNDVLRMLEKASMAGLKEEEVLELLHSLLTTDPYPTLKGTIHQENVDALIGRELERYGSIHPAPEVIRKLWEVDG